MADTKITRLRNLLTPMKNYIAMVNADKRGESISTLLLDRELENINKYSDEIWAIIAEIPNDACEGNTDDARTEPALHKHIVSNNEVAVCDHPTNRLSGINGVYYCNKCRKTITVNQTDC
jgi:hypothetical protein